MFDHWLVDAGLMAHAQQEKLQPSLAVATTVRACYIPPSLPCLKLCPYAERYWRLWLRCSIHDESYLVGVEHHTHYMLIIHHCQASDSNFKGISVSWPKGWWRLQQPPGIKNAG